MVYKEDIFNVMYNTIYDARSASFLGRGFDGHPLHCFKILERESMTMQKASEGAPPTPSVMPVTNASINLKDRESANG